MDHSKKNKSNRWLFVLVACLFFIGLLLILRLCGGFYHQKFSRFAPVREAVVESESNFRISVWPEFQDGSYRKKVIPGFWYSQSETSRNPHLLILSHHDSERNGHAGKTKVHLSSVIVENETGDLFHLIANEEKSFRLSGRFWWRKDLGAISGQHFKIKVIGEAETDSGERLPFSQSEEWRANYSSRTNLSIMEMP